MATTKTTTKTTTTTKKKAAEKAEIELSSEKQALIEAIATGNTDGVDLAAVQELLGSLGLAAVAKGVQVAKTSRIQVKRRWESATELSDEEKGKIDRLVEVLGKTPIFTTEDEVRDFNQAEVDQLVEELDTMYPVADIVEGRRQALRQTAFNIITLRNDGDAFATGDLKSPKNGKKVAVTKQVRRSEPDYTRLKDMVDEDVWKDLVSEEVTVTYLVDEEKIATALADGRITFDQFVALVPEEKVTRVFSLKDMKEGEPI